MGRIIEVQTAGEETRVVGCPKCREQKAQGETPMGEMPGEEVLSGEMTTGLPVAETPGERVQAECGCRMKHREDGEYRNLMNRLKRIEGQVRGIQGMVEEERYCVDILTQVMAVQSALNSFNKALLSNHIKTCVVRDIQDGNHDVVDELCSTIQKLMK